MTRDPNQPGSDRTRRIIETYGADPARWPADERARPEHGLEQGGTEIDQLRAAEGRIDALLDTLPGGSPSPDLARKIMAEAPTAPVPRPSLGNRLAALWSWEQAWRPAAALALTAVVGIALGAIVYSPNTDNAGETESPRQLAFDQAGAEGPQAYNDTYSIEGDWEFAFDPAGIELTSFFMEDM